MRYILLTRRRCGHRLRTAVISAVVIGGTSLFGSIGTMVGVALIGVLQNWLQFNNVSSCTQSIVIGLIPILAVAFDRFLKSRVRR